MMAAGFHPFGMDHLVVLAVTTGLAGFMIATRARLCGRPDQGLRWTIAGVLAINMLIAYAVALSQGVVLVPLQLCDLALLCTIWALLRPQWFVAELAYFWGLAGSLQAVLTPDLQEGFPGYWWIKFFLSHCGVVLSVVYLAATGRVQPTHRSVWRVFGLTNVYMAIAGLANWAWGTNYGYLAHKPTQPSMLDQLGPWPYYILAIELIALASFYLYYAPLAWGRRTVRL